MGISRVKIGKNGKKARIGCERLKMGKKELETGKKTTKL